jgi:isoquinoline 1-oxidoreductase beta subunit
VERCERVFGKYRYEAVAVIAENYWAAYKGRKALVVKWDNQGKEKFNSKVYEQSLRDWQKQRACWIMHRVILRKAFQCSF